MNHIGNVIREYRIMLHVSRKELSTDICSEKYLYMIEKGDRTPSTEVMRLLSNRMGVDIFKYYEYLDCMEPIKVCSFVEEFYRHRRENNLTAILKDTEEASRLQDFQNAPWKHEIKINRLMVRIFANNGPAQTIPILIDTIAEIKHERINNIALASFYVMLSTCYQMINDMDNARKNVVLACEITAGRQGMAKCVYITTVVKINKITMHYLSGEFDEVIEHALALIEYEGKMRYKGYSDHASFYLAFAYFQIGQEEKGIQWFYKAIGMMLLNPNANDMYYLSKYEMFNVLIRDKRMAKGFVDEFKNEYKLIVV